MTVVAAHRGSHPPCHCSKPCHPLEFSKSTELRPNITVWYLYSGWQEYQQSSAFQTCEETRQNLNGINYGFRRRRGTCSSSSSSWYYCYNSLRLNKYLDKLDTDWVEWSRRADDDVVVVVVVKEVHLIISQRKLKLSWSWHKELSFRSNANCRVMAKV